MLSMFAALNKHEIEPETRLAPSEAAKHDVSSHFQGFYTAATGLPTFYRAGWEGGGQGRRVGGEIKHGGRGGCKIIIHTYIYLTQK